MEFLLYITITRCFLFYLFLSSVYKIYSIVGVEAGPMSLVPKCFSNALAKTVHKQTHSKQ